jgi:hypothetical protein
LRAGSVNRVVRLQKYDVHQSKTHTCNPTSLSQPDADDAGEKRVI